MKKYVWLYGGIIALSFLWTGSAYISVAYRLMEYYTPFQIDIYHVIIGYLLQVCGILLFSLGLRYRKDIFSKRLFFPTVMIAEAIVIAIAMFSTLATLSFVFSFIMNLLHGFVAGVYLTQLSSFVPQQYRGRAFGMGYAAGSVGSWIISLFFDDNFLKMDEVVIVYLILITATIFLTSKVSTDYSINEVKLSINNVNINSNSLINIFIVLILLSMVKNIGFHFPASDISEIINLEFSRAFYAIGLISAGIKQKVWSNMLYSLFGFFLFLLCDDRQSGI